MSILSDKRIAALSRGGGMITPFEPGQVSKVDGVGVVSYGVSSYGYDIRISDEWMIPKPGMVANVKDRSSIEKCFTKRTADVLELPPHSGVLGLSVETFSIPRNILCIALGKSTWARLFVNVNITPLEPEWTGRLVIEISNNGPLTVPLYANEGIAQLIFFVADEVCHTSYAEKKGKYQAQQGVTLAKV